MKKNKIPYKILLGIFLLPLLFAMTSCNGIGQKVNLNYSTHPQLLLSKWGIDKIKNNKNNPLIKKSLDKIRLKVEQSLKLGVKVPVPAGFGAGYSHEQNKKNGYLLYWSGLLYQITGEKKYAEYAKKMFLKYAEMYPTLGLHPHHSKTSPGKLFWQSLNSSVWLVYAIQGYDFLYDYLKPSDRQKIEGGILLPMARFLSVESPHNFDRIHNHATWAVAGVGMTGYVLDKKDLVKESLYGLHKDGKGGFYAQINQLFSPDGYYREGPYYQRYAMLPFLLFADVVKQHDPEKNMLAYRDSVLIKAVNALLQMTSPRGAFFPFNDDIKDKTFLSPEIILAVDMAYAYGGKNPELLDVAEKQNRVTLTDAGVMTALNWQKGIKKPFHRHSIFLSDGSQGHKGGIGILRYGRAENQTTLVMKATSHGMGHGHFDELDMLAYDNGDELIRDYGSVRFLNVEAKSGGRYLPQNNTWAKQTIASNSFVVDETSQYNGNLKRASLPTSHPVFLAYSASDSNFQYMSVLDTTAYPGVKITRTMVLSKLPVLQYPIIIDVVHVKSDSKHQYDIPFYYKGHLIATNFPKNVSTECLKPLGKDYGYQYLWLNGTGMPDGKNAQITWLNNNRFYTLTTLTDKNSKVLFTTIGANDPKFNLRNEHGVILRENSSRNFLFVNIIEPHGEYNATDEFTTGSFSQIKDISVETTHSKLYKIAMSFKNGKSWAYTLPDSILKNQSIKPAHNQLILNH
jgi:hypothetical protein